MRSPLLSAVMALMLSAPCFAQRNIAVSVDHFTGRGDIYLPVTEVQKGSISVPIGLAYSGGGVKLRDIEGDAGMNWNLVAGGQVYRELRGLPDDVKANQASQVRLGPGLGETGEQLLCLWYEHGQHDGSADAAQ